MASAQPFRVIVVGAGISGLCLSHELQLAGIDHIVLEKHSEIVSYAGGAIGLWPQTARVFDQFGCLDRFEEGCSPITRECRRGPNGETLFKFPIWGTISKKFDAKTLLMDRHACVRKLYESLPDQSRVVMNKKTVDITQSDDAVTVILDDGTTEKGDMVIGADGVHSVVRELMWKHANEQNPGTITEKEKKALTTEWDAIFGVSALPAGLGPGDSHMIHGYDRTGLCFTQPDRAYWAIMTKAAGKQQWPFTKKFTEKEMERKAELLKDMKINETVTFSELWEGRSRAGMLQLEEGVLKHWHSGRIVLVGDAAHKMTTDLALGANTAIEGTVTLVNLLHRELKSDKNRHITTAQLRSLFEEYVSTCKPRAENASKLSGDVMRMNALQSNFAVFSAHYLFPYIAPFLAKDFVKLIGTGPKLDFVPTKKTNEEAEGWRDAKPKDGGGAFSTMLVMLTAGGAMAAYAISRYGLPLLRK